MASPQAIAVIGNTLRNLLAEACPRDLFPDAQFNLVLSGGLAGPSVPELGVTIYLYRVEFGSAQRNLPPRTQPSGNRLRPPTPLDLHYLITAWARSAELQGTLLAWTIRTLEGFGILPAALLNQNASDTPSGSASAVFNENEVVALRSENLSVQDMASTWEAAKANQQPSVSFVVRSVLIDSASSTVKSPEPIRTRKRG